MACAQSLLLSFSACSASVWLYICYIWILICYIWILYSVPTLFMFVVWPYEYFIILISGDKTCGEHFFSAMLIVQAVCISVTVHVCAVLWQEDVIKTKQDKTCSGTLSPYRTCTQTPLTCNSPFWFFVAPVQWNLFLHRHLPHPAVENSLQIMHC